MFIPRLILASHSELHNRIAELEKALAIAHGKTSSSPHPLLTNTFLYSPREPRGSVSSGTHIPPVIEGEESDDMGDSKRRKSMSDVARNRRLVKEEEEDVTDESSDVMINGRPSKVKKHEDDLVDVSFGTLTITESGQSRFVGSAAGSSFLHIDGRDENTLGPHGSMSSQRKPSDADSLAMGGHVPLMNGGSQSFNRSQTLEQALGDFPFGLTVTSSQEALSLYELWQRVPAWDDLPVRGSLASRRHFPETPIATGGSGMVQAYFQNIDWMYKLVPVSELLC